MINRNIGSLVLFVLALCFVYASFGCYARAAITNEKVYRVIKKDTKEPLSVRQQKKQACDRHIEQGQKFLENGDPLQASYEFQQAVSLNPQYIPAQHALADLYRRTGSSDEAIRVYRYIITLDPDDMDAYIALVAVYNDLENYDESIIVLQEAIARDYENPSLYELLAQVYHTLGKIDEARYHFERARQLYLEAHQYGEVERIDGILSQSL